MKGAPASRHALRHKASKGCLTAFTRQVLGKQKLSGSLRPPEEAAVCSKSKCLKSQNVSRCLFLAFQTNERNKVLPRLPEGLAILQGMWSSPSMDEADRSMDRNGYFENRADLERRAEKLGIDLALLEENLRLAPLERMRQHDRCVRQILTARRHLGVDETICNDNPRL